MARSVAGKKLALGLVAVAAAMGAGLYYALVFAWHEPVDGLTSVAVAGVDLPVRGYRGLDGDASPLKLRACFEVDPALVAGPAPQDPAPLIAPGWFDCFDAVAIGRALERGEARAVVAEAAPPGFERIVAVFPDGRAFMWRQVVAQ
jgi:hypothetical protein